MPSEVLELIHTDGIGLITLNQLVLENKFAYTDGGSQGDALCSPTLKRLQEKRRW